MDKKESSGKPRQFQASINTSMSDGRCPECDCKLMDGSCFYCDRQRKEKSAEAESVRLLDIERLGGLRGVKTFTWGNLRPTKGNQDAMAALKEFPGKTANVFLFGPAGCGKTHMATAAIQACGRIVRAAKLIQDMRDEVMDRNPAMTLDDYAKAFPLVIDDLGAGKDTEFSVAYLLSVIDRRWMDMRDGLIVTSNLSPDQLTVKFGDDRIVSRLAGMCRIFNLKGETDGRVRG